WELHVTNGIGEQQLLDLLKHENENMRSWAIQLLVEGKKASPKTIRAFADLASKESAPLVRLYLSAALQRVDLAQRWDMVKSLSLRAEDYVDQNIPLMFWYAFEP